MNGIAEKTIRVGSMDWRPSNVGGYGDFSPITVKSLKITETQNPGNLRIPTVERLGWTFNGWYTAQTEGTQITEGAQVPTEPTTYYAQYTDSTKPEITSVTPSTTLDTSNYVDFTAIDNGAGIAGYNITSTDEQPTNWIPVVDAVEEHTETKWQYDAAWARIFHHNNHYGDVFFSNEDDWAEAKSVDTVDKYSVLGNLEKYRNNDGKYEFLLQYPKISVTDYNRWEQNDNPVTINIPITGGGGAKVPGFRTIHSSWSGYWNGLAKGKDYSLLDGNAGISSSFYAIGAVKRAWGRGTGMIGPYPKDYTSTVNLWSRIDNKTVTPSNNLTRRTGDLTQNGIYYIWIKDANGNIDSKAVEVKKVDNEKPLVDVISTNNVANSQTLTLNMADNTGITEYYWGTVHDPSVTNLTWTSYDNSTSATISKTVNGNTTYYVGAKDAAGNMTVVGKTFYITTLNPSGGVVTPSKTCTMKGNTINLPAPTPPPGYNFDGWFTEETGGEKITNPYTPNASKSLYAHYSAGTYTVSFDPNGGNVTPPSKQVTYGQPYGDLPTPTKDECEFQGWTTNNLLNYKQISSTAYDHGIRATDDGYIYDVSPSKDSRDWGYNQSNWHEKLEPGNYILSLEFKKQIKENLYSAMNLYNEKNPKVKLAVNYPSIRNVDSCNLTFNLTETTNIGIFIKSYDGIYRIKLTKGNDVYTTSDTIVETSLDHTLVAQWKDTTAPTVTFGTNGNSTPSNRATTSVTVNDNGSGINESTFKYLWTTRPVGITKEDFTGNLSGTFTQGNTVELPNGNAGDFYLYIYAEDNEGNAVIGKSEKFVAGNVLPGADITMVPSEDWGNTGTVINIKPYAPTVLYDTGYVKATTRNKYALDNGQWSGSWVEQQSPFAENSYGGKKFRVSGAVQTVSAEDETLITGAGFSFSNNTGANSGRSWKRAYEVANGIAKNEQTFNSILTIPLNEYKDSLRPWLQINIEAGVQGYEVEYKNLKYEYFDATKIAYVKVNGETVSITDGTATYTAQENGSYTIEVTDIYGNTWSETKAIGNVDVTPPTINANNITYGQDLSINLADVGSGVKAWQVTTSSVAPTEGWTEFETPVASTETPIIVSELTAGTWYVWAKDEAENASSKQVIVYKKATTITVTPPGTITSGNIATFTARVTPEVEGIWNITSSTNAVRIVGGNGIQGTSASISYQGQNVGDTDITISFTPIDASNDKSNTMFRQTVEAGNFSITTGATTAYYNSMGLALAAIPNNNATAVTIKQEQDCDDASSFIVSNGKKVIFDNNGKTLNKTEYGITVNSGTTLEIAGNGTITTADENLYSDSGNRTLVHNQGTLDITHTGMLSSERTGNSNLIENKGTLNKTGTGTIVNAGKYSTIANHGSSANATISAGTISSTTLNPSSTSTATIAIYDRATLNIEGSAKITAENTAIVCGRNEGLGTLIMTGGEIYAKTSNAIRCDNNGTLTITGGKITSEEVSSVWFNKGTVNVGEPSSSFNTTTPSITSGTYGIFKKADGTWNFYNGIIKGKTAAVSSNPAQVRDGYDVAIGNQGEYETATLKPIPTLSLAQTQMQLTTGQGNGQIDVNYNGDGALTATSSNPSVATVSVIDHKIIVTPVSQGTATITVSSQETDNYLAQTLSAEDGCELTVESGMKLSMILSSGNYEGTYDGGEHTITGPSITTPSSGYEIYYSTKVSLTSNNYNDTSSTTESTTTKPTRTDAGTTTVYWYVHSTDGNYEDESGSNTITINQATVTLSNIPTELQYVGKDMQKTISGTSSVAGNWTVTSGDGNVTISSGESTTNSTTGTFKIRGETASTTASTITVAFTPTSSNYVATTETFTAKVTDLSLSSTSGTIVLGNGNLTSTISSTNAGTISIDTSATGYNASIATASISGNTLTVTPVSVGTATITIKETNANKTATFTATITAANYSVSSGSPTYHTILATAYAACDEGGTITVEEDNTDGSIFTIAKDITLNLQNHTIIRENNTINVNSGKALTITGITANNTTGSITSTNLSTITVTDGTLNVNSGNIISTLGRAIYNNGTNAVTKIGLASEALSTTSPSISGSSYGVYNELGKWEYKNGEIQGATSYFYDNDVTTNGGLEGGVRTDYIIVPGTNENYKTAHLEKMTDVTSPWLPSGASYTNSDLNTGVTIKDSYNNEWTWVVVPTTITAGVNNIASATNPTNTPLENALIQYAATVVTDRGNFKDTWVTGMDSTTYSSGLSSTVYNNKKRKMLNSIKEHGGFWIGKYEVGFTETPTSSNYNQTTRTAVIKKDVYPYNWISCSDANTKAMNLATQAGGEGALLFGTQWDLTLCYLVNRGGVSQRAVTYKSTNWGNYKDTNLTANNNKAKYLSNNTSWLSFSGKNSGTGRILTTGAVENTTNKMNIVDLAGNMNEWTLEYSGESSGKNTLRGGDSSSDGYVGSYQGPSSYRDSSGQSFISRTGYRATLY